MNCFARLGLALALCMPACVVLAGSEENVSQSRSVDARIVRVKLEGLVDLTLRQGPAATLVLSGDRELLARAISEAEGDTLTIGTEGNTFRWSRRQLLRAELTLPQLREVSSDSVGTADIQGFGGDELELSLDGAGSMKVRCAYRLVSAVLGGVGSMDIHSGSTEGVDLNLRGAGVVNLRGSSKWLKASLNGLGSLNAQHFEVDTVTLDLSGLGNASVWARQNATLNLSGLGSVTVHGKPANRNATVTGLGRVSWK